MDPPPSNIHSPSILTNTWDESVSPPPIPGAKLRFMCSYGGHFIPRPHNNNNNNNNNNKSLCYVGGDTRMVVLDRLSSLQDLCSRLSRTLLNGRPFSLKYQLPNEQLDSLISVTTDEDLDNMIEEYDRSTASPLKPSRLRLFLFLAKPQTATSMGNLLNDAKSETWFVDALSGTGLLPRGLSDSATINCLVDLNHGVADNIANNNCIDLEAQVISNTNNGFSSDSPMVEINSSSFGSETSSPSMSNLPPIRTRVEEEGIMGNNYNDNNKVPGIDGQFVQLSVALKEQNQDTATRVPGGENPRLRYPNSEHCTVPVGFRKPPLALTMQLNSHTAYNLHSPDTIASDSSLISGSSFSTPVYHDTIHADASRDNKDPNNQEISDSQIHHFHESGYLMHPQLDEQQQQFMQGSTHYIHHPSTGLVQVSPPYYSMYAPPLHSHPMYRLSPAAYTMESQLPTIYPTKIGPAVPKCETPPLGQQYVGVGLTQVHNQTYFTPTGVLPSQYQTMTQTAPAAYLSDAALSQQSTPDIS